MKMMHISDLHIGRQLHGYNMREDQEYILEQITELAAEEQPQALLIAGDVFDRSVPSGEAYTMLDAFLDGLTARVPDMSVFMIAGNHDSPERLSYAGRFLQKHRIYISAFPPQQRGELMKGSLEDEWGTVNIWLLPFVRPGVLQPVINEDGSEQTFKSTQEAFGFILGNQNIDKTQRNVLIAHQLFIHNGKLPESSDSETVSVQIGGLDQVESELMKDFDYCALGHIHRPQSAGAEKYRYCGTPLAYSSGEAGQTKSVTIVNLGEKGESAKIRTVDLKPLRRVIKLEGELSQLLMDREHNDDYVSITLTDEGELYMPKEQLEEVFGHILELIPRRSRLPMEAVEQGNSRSPGEIFEDFYREIWDRNLSEEELALMEEILSEAAGEEQEGV